MSQFVLDHIGEIVTACVTAIVCVVVYSFTIGRKVAEIATLRNDLEELNDYEATRITVQQHEKRLDQADKRMDQAEQRYETRFLRLEQTINEIHADVAVVVAWVQDQKKGN